MWLSGADFRNSLKFLQVVNAPTSTRPSSDCWSHISPFHISKILLMTYKMGTSHYLGGKHPGRRHTQTHHPLPRFFQVSSCTSIFAFGGQGVNEICLGELQTLFNSSFIC